MPEDFSIFCGNGGRRLGEAVARAVGVPIGLASIDRFPDGEVSVQIDEPLRRKDVFIVQSTAPPVNDHLMELLAFADASRRASAARIIAVMPYFGYARSDRRHAGRQPISARLVADLIETAGIHHVITLDLHACQIEGFFRIPVDSLSATTELCDAVRHRLPPGTVVVSPDSGRLALATEYAERLNTAVILLHKIRRSATETRVTHVVGDVRDRPCLIVDDMISTGGTIAEGVEVLLEAGARPGIFVAATHGVLLEGARPRLTTPSIADVFITDTIEQRASGWPGLQVVSVAARLADAIQHVRHVRPVGRRT